MDSPGSPHIPDLRSSIAAPPPRDGRSRLLLVDDEPGIRNALSSWLRHRGESCDVARDAMEARTFLERQSYDVVLSDIAMPEVSGLELLAEIKERDPRIEVVMITAFLDVSHAIEALRRGAYDFLAKPFSFDQALITIERARRKRRLEEELMRHRHAERRRRFEEEAMVQMVLGLARAVEERDRCNIGHGQRTARFAERIGEALRFPAARLRKLRYAGLVHDVGKIGIDDRVLNKPGRLTEDEYEHIKRHPEVGAHILKPITLLQDLAPAVRHHHERWDGRGYPDGLSGERIPLDARILAIADFFDSLTSKRPYREPLPCQRALEMIDEERGRMFDPILAELFLAQLAPMLSAGG